MSPERVIVCGGLPCPRGVSDPVTLRRWGKDANVDLRVSDISKALVANVPDLLADLLDIAAYVYCADIVTTRGGGGVLDNGAGWYRHFRFHIPVRVPDLWKAEAICSRLCRVLADVSQDDFEFHFRKLRNAEPSESCFEFGEGGPAEEVILFSGGIDSLGGAVQEVINDNRQVALVSHRSNPKVVHRQVALAAELRKRSGKRAFHVPVWVTKDSALDRENTQRTRSFLYASLAAVVARLYKLHRVRFYENGVVSINLPISAQLLGSRASRTTHPMVLNGYSDFFSQLFGERFQIENPFLWKTKADIVRLIRDAKCGDLIAQSISCANARELTKEHPHCGRCSQCVDRAFATRAAGCSAKEDPPGQYVLDLLTGERAVGNDRTLAESYVRTARRLRTMNETAFFAEFPEVARAIKQCPGLSVHEAATRFYQLFQSHAENVDKVVNRGIAAYASDISNGRLPASCLLILALPELYRSPSDHPADGESRNGVIRALGNRRYQIGELEPVLVETNEDCVFQAFLKQSPMDGPTLIRKSGVNHAQKVLQRLRQKYEGVFRPAIRMPRERGKGGYHVTIEQACPQTCH